MTVRSGRSEFRGLTIAAALVVPLLAGGCATPLTHLEWGTERTAQNERVIVPKPRPAYSRYAYRDDYGYRDNYGYTDRDEVPVPRARPHTASSWFSHDYYRPSHEDVSSDRPSNAYASFQWPVRGRVITEFGTYSDGGRNDGLNISANYGDPIRAAADGTVSYSGELRSYGNLALVRHENGYVTAYAHADHFIVAKGDHVARGQVIGYVGSSGDVTAPQLHFELRKGARGETPVNPRPLLGPAQVAAR